ncbi:MAG TPA: hypothetical protein VF406_20945 [Thermodesulfobacteriota bacterium]
MQAQPGAGDQAGARSYARMGLLGLGVSGIDYVAAPISLARHLDALGRGCSARSRSSMYGLVRVGIDAGPVRSGERGGRHAAP